MIHVKGDAIVDMNDDGFADLLRTSSNGSQSTWEVYEGTGGGWGD